MRKRLRNNPPCNCPSCDQPCCTSEECRAGCACCQCRGFHQLVEPTLRAWQYVTDHPDDEMAWEWLADVTVPVSPETERTWNELSHRAGTRLEALKSLCFAGSRGRGRPPRIPRAVVEGVVQWIDHLKSLWASGADVVAHLSQEPLVTSGQPLAHWGPAIVQMFESVPTRGSRLIAAVLIHALTGRHVLRRGRQRAQVERLRHRWIVRRWQFHPYSHTETFALVAVNAPARIGRPRGTLAGNGRGHR